MTTYEVRLYVLVTVEAATPQDAERVAMERGPDLLKAGAGRITAAINALDARVLGTR